MPRITVVVPCYNEAERLDTAAFEGFARAHADYQFLMVDDGSTDATGQVLAGLCEALPEQFRALSLPRNQGKAEAVRAGLREAFAQGAQMAGYWDADLATPLSELPAFVEVLEARPQCLLVMGARVSLLGRDIRRRTSRHYLGRIFATAAATALGMPVYDTQCGAKLMRDAPLIRHALEEPFRSRWIFDVELLSRLVVACERDGGPGARDRVHELPLTCWHDVAGSRLKSSDFARAALELAQIVRYRG